MVLLKVGIHYQICGSITHTQKEKPQLHKIAEQHDRRKFKSEAWAMGYT